MEAELKKKHEQELKDFKETEKLQDTMQNVSLDPTEEVSVSFFSEDVYPLP
jgi:hypothetical protein